MTNGPHAHGIADPRDPALNGRPQELIHPFPAAQVGVDKSSQLESQLQGHHSVDQGWEEVGGWQLSSQSERHVELRHNSWGKKTGKTTWV